MLINRVSDGLMGENNSAFVAFYTDPVRIYDGADSLPESLWTLEIPLLGAVLRWDGSVGLVGGEVEPSESLIDAAIRESYEEVGYEPAKDSLKLVCSHSMVSPSRPQNTHLFACKVSMHLMYEIRMRACNSRHGQSESAGFNVLHMNSQTIENLPLMHWAGTALSEVRILLTQGIIAPARQG